VNQPKIRFSSIPSSTLTMGVACKEGVSQTNKIANLKKKQWNETHEKKKKKRRKM